MNEVMLSIRIQSNLINWRPLEILVIESSLLEAITRMVSIQK